MARNTKFFHVIGSGKRSGGLTLAVEAIPDSDVVRYGVSYCAPIEANFSRPTGRLIAEGRLRHDRELPQFKRSGFYSARFDMLKFRVLTDLRDKLPIGWAKSLVRRELDRLTEIRTLKEEEAEQLSNSPS